MKKVQLLPIIVLSFFIIPSIAMASWWNPFSWFKKNPQPVEQPTTQVQQNNLPAVVEKKITIPPVNNVGKKTTKKVSTPTILPVVNTSTTQPTLKTGGGASPGVMVGPCPILGPCITPPVIINNSVNNTISPVVNPEVTQICQKVSGLNPKLLGNLILKDIVSLATQLQSDCASGLDSALIKSKLDSYQQLVNWDKSSLVAFVSNPTPDSNWAISGLYRRIKTGKLELALWIYFKSRGSKQNIVRLSGHNCQDASSGNFCRSSAVYPSMGD